MNTTFRSLSHDLDPVRSMALHMDKCRDTCSLAYENSTSAKLLYLPDWILGYLVYINFARKNAHIFLRGIVYSGSGGFFMVKS